MGWLIVGVICGVVCALIAASKGRSAIGWFFIGFLIGIIGLIIILCLSNLKEEQRYREHAAAERRRLAEQLRQERMKNESFRQYSAQRIDAHDRALGVDTRAAQGLAGGAEAAPGLPEPPPVPRGGTATAWFYEHGGQSRGPVPRSRVVDLLRNGAITRETLVWREGDPDWRRVSDVDDFREPLAT